MWNRNLIFAGIVGGILMAGCGTSPSISKASSASASSTASSSTADAGADATTETTTPDATEPSDSQDPEQYNDMPLGQSISVSGTDNNDRPWTMSVVVNRTQTSKRTQSQYGSAPKHTFLGVRVIYACTKGLCDYNPYDFTLRAKDGTTFDLALGEGFTPELGSGTMHKGAKASGWITWDVKPGKYTVEYSTFTNVASWVVTFK